MGDEQTDLARALKLIEWLDAERKNDKALITELGRQLEVLSMQVREQGTLLRQTQEDLGQTASQVRRTPRLEESLKQGQDRMELLQQRMDQLEKASDQVARLREVAEERQQKAFTELRQQVLGLAEEFSKTRAGQFQEAKLEAARQSLVDMERRTTGLERNGEGMAARLLLAEETLPRLTDRVTATELRMDEVGRDEAARQAQVKVIEERSRRSVEAAAIAQQRVEETLEQSKTIAARTKLVEEQGRRAEAQTARIEALENWRLQQQELWTRWEERGLNWTNQILALQERTGEMQRYDEKQLQQWRQFMEQYKLHRDEAGQALEQERDDRREQDTGILTHIDKWRAQVQEEFVETRRVFDERVAREHRLWTDWQRFEVDSQGRQMGLIQDYMTEVKNLLRAAQEEKPLAPPKPESKK